MTTIKNNIPLGERILSGTIGAALHLFASPKNVAMPTRIYNAANTFFSNVGGAYDGARHDRQTRNWIYSDVGADEETLSDLPELRQRSRDLFKNNPLGRGAINTALINVIGSGLQLQSNIDRDFLRLSDEEADKWEANTERRFAAYANTTEIDSSGMMNLDELSNLAYLTVMHSGEVFVALPYIKRKFSQNEIRVKLYEPEQVINPNNEQNSNTMRDGIEIDEHGRRKKYHFKKNSDPFSTDTIAVDAYGKLSGRPNVLHIYKQERVGQTHGVPFLSSVIKKIKQRDRYVDNELIASVVSAMFTVFIESNNANAGQSPMEGLSKQGTVSKKREGKDYVLGPGAINILRDGDTIKTAKPERPNQAFEQFITANIKEVGMALNIPFEILAKQFMSSYSASRAAREEAWKYFSSERKWFTNKFHQVIYTEWMTEEILVERIQAPGFLTDPIIKQAYLKTTWIGAGPGQIDEGKAVKASKARVAEGYSTNSQETANLTGGNWEKNMKQLKIEKDLVNKLFPPKIDEQTGQVIQGKEAKLKRKAA